MRAAHKEKAAGKGALTPSHSTTGGCFHGPTSFQVLLLQGQECMEEHLNVGKNALEWEWGIPLAPQGGRGAGCQERNLFLGLLYLVKLRNHQLLPELPSRSEPQILRREEHPCSASALRMQRNPPPPAPCLPHPRCLPSSPHPRGSFASSSKEIPTNP